ncbi:MAG: N4-gp56 family major capsid protein [Planctomycetota bacterium]|nr:N4-gp56 family major capsid protein [Planctomycetota bacterium]
MAISSTATTTSDLTANMQIYYDKILLTRLQPQLVAYQFGKKKVVPVHQGKNIVWTIYTDPTVSTVALSEGITPTAIALSSSNVSATVAGYGKHTEISDFLSITAIDSVIESATEIFADYGAKLIDTLCLKAVSSGTEQLARAKSALSDLAVSDTLNASEIRKAVRTLENANARPHPLTAGFYPLLIHPYTKYDLIGDTGTGQWLDVRKYTESNQRDIDLNKVGDLYGAKVYMTQNLQTVSSTVRTYQNLLLSAESFGVVDITGLPGGGKPRIIVKQLGSGGTYDPLDQQATVGVKVYFVAKILATARVVVIKTGATA